MGEPARILSNRVRVCAACACRALPSEAGVRRPCAHCLPVCGRVPIADVWCPSARRWVSTGMNIKHVSLGAREHEDMGAWRAGGGRANLSICPRSRGSMCARVGWIVDCEMWNVDGRPADVGAHAWRGCGKVSVPVYAGRGPCGWVNVLSVMYAFDTLTCFPSIVDTRSQPERVRCAFVFVFVSIFWAGTGLFDYCSHVHTSRGIRNSGYLRML